MKTIKRYFISDLHYFHKGIIFYCKRPYSSVSEMNQDMIVKWNSKVGKEDVVYILGDFGFCGVEAGKKILDSLNGTKILVCGNHDEKSQSRLLRMGFKEVHSFDTVIDIAGQNVRLCHFPYTTTGDKIRYYKRFLKHWFFKTIGYNIEHNKKWLHELKKRKINIIKKHEDLMLHGHDHGIRPTFNYKVPAINVAADRWNFTPISEDSIVFFMFDIFKKRSCK